MGHAGARSSMEPVKRRKVSVELRDSEADFLVPLTDTNTVLVRGSDYGNSDVAASPTKTKTASPGKTEKRPRYIPDKQPHDHPDLHTQGGGSIQQQQNANQANVDHTAQANDPDTANSKNNKNPHPHQQHRRQHPPRVQRHHCEASGTQHQINQQHQQHTGDSPIHMGSMRHMNNPHNATITGVGGPYGAGAHGGYGNFAMGSPSYYGGGGGYGFAPMQMHTQQQWCGPGYGQFLGHPHMQQYAMRGGNGSGGYRWYGHPQAHHSHPLSTASASSDPYLNHGSAVPVGTDGSGSSARQSPSQQQFALDSNAKATMGLLTNRSPVLLYMSCDDDSLSGYQCLVRRQVELFEARSDDVESNAQGRNKPIVLGQVGIRCRHCTSLPPRHRARASVYYPAKLMGLYQAAQNMATIHLCQHCQRIPSSVRSELLTLRERKSSAGGGKKYWGDGARVLGVYEAEDGLRFGR